MKHSIVVNLFVSILLFLSVACYAQGVEEYTLFVADFENKSDVVNPMLSELSNSLNYSFSRSKLAKIHPVSPGLRSAYLRRARIEQPNIEPTQLALLAAGYGKADAVLVGNYDRTGEEWTMTAQLFVMREGGQARENIQLSGEDIFFLLDGLSAEVSKRLGAGEYILLSTKSWEAYDSYLHGHRAYYNFDTMGAMKHFQRAIELDPQLAIAHAELALCHLMMNDIPNVDKVMAEATKNLQNVSEQERFTVMGLAGYYAADRPAFLGSEGFEDDFPDMPRMRDDLVWDEPWLHWNIARSSEDEAMRDSEYRQWLTSALAYAKAGFYDALKLAEAGAAGVSGFAGGWARPGRCVRIFNETGDPQFLEAAIQFIQQAASADTKDEYDDAWEHWQLSRVYELMDKDTDVQQHRKEWLRVVRSMSLDNLTPDAINKIARNCLELEEFRNALQFAQKALLAESNPIYRPLYLVTQADIHFASGELGEAFRLYVETFEVSVSSNAMTSGFHSSLSGLTRLMNSNPEFVDESKRTKLNQMIETIGNMDPLLFRSESARQTTSDLSEIRDFCRAMGDMNPVMNITRGMFRAETNQSEQLVFLNYLASLGGDITESEVTLVRDLLEVETEPSNKVRLLNVLYASGASLTESELEQIRQIPFENSGFESGSIAPWGLHGDVPKVVTELVGATVPEVPAEGNFCLHITVNEPGVNFWDVNLGHNGHLFEEGKIYTLSAWLKAKEGTFDINLKAELSMEPYTDYGSQILTMTDTWAEYHVTTPPMPETIIAGRITFHCAFSAGEFWIDGVRFYEGEFVPSTQRAR